MNGPGCTSPTLCLLRALGCLLLLFFNKPSCLAQATGIPSVSGARNVSATKTELGIKGARFTIDGKTTFLYGISYYAALGASEGFIRSDLDDMHRHGFNWTRVWANWRAFGADAAAVDGEGRRIPAGLKKLKWLLTECDRRGLVVDVTFSRGNGVNGTPQLQTLDAHRRAVETVVTALKPRRNWYLDLSNERNVQDKRFTGIDDLKQLRELAVRLDPDLLVTASDGGDITWDSLREYLQTVKVDFISPHRPRDARSPAQTEAKTKEYLAQMKRIGRVVPVHYQEPFRRGYGKWEPKTEDFAADLRGALAGGAAGWCFHNGAERDAPDGQPRRSFDLREKRLFDQLDDEERQAIELLKTVVGRDSVLWRSNPYCGAGFETCCVTDFQIGAACNGVRSAGLETHDWLASSRSLGPSGLAFASLRQSLSRPPKPLKSGDLEVGATSVAAWPR